MGKTSLESPSVAFAFSSFFVSTLLPRTSLEVTLLPLSPSSLAARIVCSKATFVRLSRREAVFGSVGERFFGEA